MTLAEAIRAIHAARPDLPVAVIARYLSAELGRPVSRQLVAATLKRNPKRGRPRRAKCATCGR